MLYPGISTVCYKQRISSLKIKTECTVAGRVLQGSVFTSWWWLAQLRLFDHVSWYFDSQSCSDQCQKHSPVDTEKQDWNIMKDLTILMISELNLIFYSRKIGWISLIRNCDVFRVNHAFAAWSLYYYYPVTVNDVREHSFK